MAKNKYVYLFSEGNAEMKNTLGGKGANLAEMTKLGLPVPTGFTISTQACTQYYKDDMAISEDIKNQILKALRKIEKISGKKFGDAKEPFLISVRSGARVSMPGMMDTILNLGLNDIAVEGLAEYTGNARFAYDSYRRFIQMFGDVVMHVDKQQYENIIDDEKRRLKIKSDSQFSADDLKHLVKLFLALYSQQTGEEFPQDPIQQLLLSVQAVFSSWQNPRAIIYRRLNDIPSEWGTAVNIQAMVFGNAGETSGTGVAFSRDPSTGENVLYGEYLMNAQGEDVVAGVRTPLPISTLRQQNERIYDEFYSYAKKLEKHYKDMQDMEFTIEDGKLYMLQTRNAKRTSQAALQIAVDMVEEKLISKSEALMKIDARSLDSLLHPTFDNSSIKNAALIASGLPASPGAATGKIVLSADAAKEMSKTDKVILVRQETSPEDIEGMISSQGIVTARGGMTSHAAVVARGMGRCCVAGCASIAINESNNTLTINRKKYREGDIISIDGSTGNIYAGELKTSQPKLTGNFATIMAWADEIKHLKIYTNADTPNDTKQAISFGAEGIGLCRTEHMFFGEKRISPMRQMILSNTTIEREKALKKLLPLQKKDFVSMYKILGGKDMVIRFIDPPLHEFVPKEKDEIEVLATEMKIDVVDLEQRIDTLKELNPMLGHRGCRLSVTYPEITMMQTKAVIEAAIEVMKKTQTTIVPKIMIPLVSDVKEMRYVRDIVTKVADEIISSSGMDMQYQVGAMIELPRAALLADEISQYADFYSFGTNDLTQMTYGFSRDDVGSFINDYYDQHILDTDPFVRIDESGVGRLVEVATQLSRRAKKGISLGICGEHGGDPSSIEFCHKIGLDYVSCSPYRVPIARLSAAQAAIKK